MVRSIFQHVDGFGTDHMIIDMSSLSFGDEVADKKHRAFIFLRNGGVKAELDFSHCSYEDKEEYLLLFMQGDVDLDCSTLASTWMDLLANDGNIGKKCILDKEEIEQFNTHNHEYVNQIHQFINSLPLYAIYVFHAPTQPPMDMTGIKSSDFDRINLKNFTQVARCPNFILLLEPQPVSDRQAVFISKLFTTKKHLFEMSILMKQLPFFNLLSLMMNTGKAPSDILSFITGETKGGASND